MLRVAIWRHNPCIIPRTSTPATIEQACEGPREGGVIGRTSDARDGVVGEAEAVEEANDGAVRVLVRRERLAAGDGGGELSRDALRKR